MAGFNSRSPAEAILMDFFRYKKGALYCEDGKVSRLADIYGTPLYVYSLKTFIRHFQIIGKAFDNKPHIICYAAKANSSLAILKTVFLLGGGADVVSGGELQLALRAGIEPEKIVYSGVGKTDVEIEFALKSRIKFISAESLPELESIARIAGRLKVAAPVSVRVNPDIDPRTHPHIATGLKNTKFGLSESDAKAAYCYIASNRWLIPVGISMHIGSQVEYVKPYVDSARKVINLYNHLKRKKLPLRYIDIGGGWAAYFRPKDNIPQPDDYVTALSGLFSDVQATIIVEPGRAIIGNAGILVMKVIAVKKSGGKNYCIVDAGMNDFIRPVLYDADHRIEPLRKKSVSKVKYDVVGPLCESGDYLSRGLSLPNVEAGDYLALFTAGAYGSSMSSNYNSRLRPTEIAVAGKEVITIRERETFRDLIKNQKLKGLNRVIVSNLKKHLGL
jgi:diaminopimelate decarboxylase